MSTPTPTTAAITPEQFAEHLRWLLGNHNFEVGDLDAASDAWLEDGSGRITVSVSTINLGTGVGGSQQFRLTVAAAGDVDEAPAAPAGPDAAHLQSALTQLRQAAEHPFGSHLGQAQAHALVDYMAKLAGIPDEPPAPELPGRVDPDAEIQLHDPDGDVW
jgi:hypothetical protein